MICQPTAAGPTKNRKRRVIRDTGSDELLAKFFKALGDTTRLRILIALTAGQKNVSELVDELGYAQSRISNHLACLRACRFVISRADGRWVTYALADARLAPLIRSAAAIVEESATYFALCASVGA